MASYESFAAVYDLFMDGAPYDAWLSNIREILSGEGIQSGIGLDLGCGTGQMTRRLAAAGFDMIGADASIEMLNVAREKSGEDILYLCQDMRSFELYGTVAFAVSVCDSMNYLTSEEELVQVFSLVNNYLDPEGLFLFDLNTLRKYREVLSDRSFGESREEGSFIWENTFDEETGINEYDLTLFVREKGDLFRRYEELHRERAYSVETVKKCLAAAGMTFVSVYDITGQDYDPSATKREYTEAAERVLFVAREKGKAKK